MSDREGTPQNQHNGPIQNPVPHSGRHHGEKNVHDFRNPDGSTMSIEDAIRGGKFRRPDGSAYTVDEIMGMMGNSEPIGLAPGSIADHTDPSTGPQTEAYTPMVETRKKKKLLTALLATGAVLLGGGGVAYGVSKIDGKANPQPTATGPAVPGTTPSANATNAPTQAPTSESTPEDPVSRASREAKQQQDELLKQREPFYKNPVTSLLFNGMVVDDKTRELLTPGLTKSDIVPGTDFFPNSFAFGTLTRSENFGQILNRQQELSTVYSDGSLEAAIAKTNALYNTNIKLQDTYITAEETAAAAKAGPNSKQALALLAKIVHTSQIFDTIAAAMRHTGALDGSEPWAQPGPNGERLPEGPLPSDKYTAMSHMFPGEQAAAKLVKDRMGNLTKPSDYVPDTVVPSSARLITNAGGSQNYNGWKFEQGRDGLEPVFAPVLGIVADVQATSIEGKYISFPQQQNLDHYVLLPVEISGKIVDVPVSLGGKTLKFLG